jgi:hypothetical protein
MINCFRPGKYPSKIVTKAHVILQGNSNSLPSCTWQDIEPKKISLSQRQTMMTLVWILQSYSMED